MIKETLAKIERCLKDPSSNREELQRLFSLLKTEVSALSHEHGEHEDFPALKNLSSSVEDFEISHPQLVAVLNNISNILANMGI